MRRVCGNWDSNRYLCSRRGSDQDMTGERKMKVRISQAAARYLRPDAPVEDRLKAARGEVLVAASEMPLVQFCLCRDADAEVRAAAVAGLRKIPEEALLQIAGCPETHPLLLEMLARLHGGNPGVAAVIAGNPGAAESIKALLGGVQSAAAGEGADQEPSENQAEPAPKPSGFPLEGLDDEEENLQEENDEKLRSNVQLAREMTIAEKIKMAMTGDKEWRMLLVKDTNKLVSGAVIKNPRITEAEILLISKSHLNNDEILRDICANKDWTKNYQIRKALVENHKTPLHSALRFLASLTDKDLAAIAKSRNISSVISTQARRLLMNKQKEK